MWYHERMLSRETLQIGDKRLGQRSKRVSRATILTPTFQDFLTSLIETMRKEELVGIAAPQVGELSRVFVTEIRKTKYRQAETDVVRVFINPTIVASSKGQATGYEGCGSVNQGNLFGQVRRAQRITLQYLDEKAVSRESSFTHLLARVIQHEIDHLDGRLFTERLTDPKTLMNREHYVAMIRK